MIRARLILFYATIVAVVCAPGIGQAGYAADRDQLKIATYNVKNMVDVFDDPYSRDETVTVKPRKQIEAIAKTIRAIDADIVSLQEVENEHVLRAMVSEMLPDMGYGFVAVEQTNASHGQHLGVLSRLPILSIESHRLRKLKLSGNSKHWRFARDVVRVRIQATENNVLSLYNVHFKSRRDSHNDMRSTRWRLAEATATRQIISSELTNDPTAWIVLAGDLNAVPQSPTINLLLKIRPDGLPMLFDAHAGLHETQRVTYLKKPHRSTVDYILTSASIRERLIKDSAFVVSDKSFLAGSDHAPVVATFRLTK